MPRQRRREGRNAGSNDHQITIDVPAADADRARAFIGETATNSAKDGSPNRLWLRIAAGIILLSFAIPVALILTRETPSTVLLIGGGIGTVAAFVTGGYVLAKRKAAA